MIRGGTWAFDFAAVQGYELPVMLENRGGTYRYANDSALEGHFEGETSRYAARSRGKTFKVTLLLASAFKLYSEIASLGPKCVSETPFGCPKWAKIVCP